LGPKICNRADVNPFTAPYVIKNEKNTQEKKDFSANIKPLSLLQRDRNPAYDDKKKIREIPASQKRAWFAQGEVIALAATRKKIPVGQARVPRPNDLVVSDFSNFLVKRKKRIHQKVLFTKI
jgi:hypothetical protein